MKRLIIMCSLLSMFGLFTNAFALDSFLSYRNLSVVGDEDTATTPETNFAIKQGYIYTNVLAANVAEVITVPTGAKFFIMNATANIWVNVGGAGTVPAGDTTNDTGSELNPTIRYLGDETTIGIISESTCLVSTMFYK